MKCFVSLGHHIIMRSQIIYWIILISMCYKKSVISVRNDMFYPIVDHIANDAKSTHIVLFISRKMNFNDVVCLSIIQKLPTILIDLTSISINSDNRSLKLPIFQHPTGSTMYIIYDNDTFNLQKILLTTINLAPLTMRPKCLFVHYSSSSNVRLHHTNVQNILTYAWSLKFVDFTILSITENEPPTTFSYNPFSEIFYETIVSVDTKMFPRKVNNLHGYPIKVPAIELPPYIHIIKDSEGKIVDMTGMSYQYCKILSENLNFTVKFIPGIEDSVIRANFSILFRKLYTGEIDMLTFPFNVRSIMYNFKDWLLMGKLFLNTNYVLVVPIVSWFKVDVPLDIILFIPLLFVIIFIYESLARLFRFPIKYWEISKIFQILLGVTVMRKPPLKFVEKIVYFSLIVLSMKYSIDTLTKILNIKLLKCELDFDSLNDIAQSRLPIYTLDFIIDHVFGNNDDRVIQKLKEKTTAIEDIYRCIYEVAENKSCMCIVPHSAGAYVAKHFVNDDGSPNMKVARASLYDDMAALGFERASPFATRFDEVIQRIVESGISDNWMSAQQYTIKPSDFRRGQQVSQNIFILQLYAVLSFGYILAVVAFAFEIICKLTVDFISKRETATRTLFNQINVRNDLRFSDANVSHKLLTRQIFRN